MVGKTIFNAAGKLFSFLYNICNNLSHQAGNNGTTELIAPRVEVIKDITNVKVPAPDLWRSTGGYDDVIEAFFVQNLTIKQLKKYFRLEI